MRDKGGIMLCRCSFGGCRKTIEWSKCCTEGWWRREDWGPGIANGWYCQEHTDAIEAIEADSLKQDTKHCS